MICYAPQFPYKGEGTDFYAFYYEHIMRFDKLQEITAKSARIQYWTPNKEIFKFPYANEFVLEECARRHIDVQFGQELVKVHTLDNGVKVATFKNVDTGAITEKDFSSLIANPPSKPH